MSRSPKQDFVWMIYDLHKYNSVARGGVGSDGYLWYAKSLIEAIKMCERYGIKDARMEYTNSDGVVANTIILKDGYVSINLIRKDGVFGDLGASGSDVC